MVVGFFCRKFLANVLFKETECHMGWGYFKVWAQDKSVQQKKGSHSWCFSGKIFCILQMATTISFFAKLSSQWKIVNADEMVLSVAIYIEKNEIKWTHAEDKKELNLFKTFKCLSK